MITIINASAKGGNHGIFSRHHPNGMAIMIAVFGIIGAAYWLIDDSRRRGMQIGGKACGAAPTTANLDAIATEQQKKR